MLAMRVLGALGEEYDDVKTLKLLFQYFKSLLRTSQISC